MPSLPNSRLEGSFYNMRCENVRNRYIKINGKTDRIDDPFSFCARDRVRVRAWRVCRASAHAHQQ